MKPDRRNFLSFLGTLGLLSLSSFNGLAKRPSVLSGNQPLKTKPYLQMPNQNSITIRWITELPSFSWVEYGEKSENLGKIAKTINHGMVEANNTIHAIELVNLEPQKTYYYRVCSKVIKEYKPYDITYGDTAVSEIYKFETFDPRKDEISFLVFNDIHDRPESFAHLLQFNENEKNDFVFLNGDMFNYLTDEDQIVNNLLKPLSVISPETPIIYSKGNHESRGTFARNLNKYINKTDQKYYFSFQHGPVYIIVLDSGEDKPDDHPVYAGLNDFDNYREEQADWLKQEIEKKEYKNAKYKIIITHIPLFYGNNWHAEQHCRKVWGPIFNKANIDLLICGHRHVHGIHKANKETHSYPIVIGGGPYDGKRALIKVKANSKNLKLDIYNDEGKIAHHLTI